MQVIPHQYQFAFQFGSEGKEQGQFNIPWDIAVNDKSRTLAVADVNNKRVQMFSFDGNFLREIALGSATSSVAFTESGDFLSSVDNDHNKLILYTEGGQFIRYISDEHVKAPLYISVGSDGRIITCDEKDKTIKRKTKFSALMGKTYFSRSVLLVVMRNHGVLLISRTNFLSLIQKLTVSWYLTTRGSIYMTLAVRDLVTDS